MRQWFGELRYSCRRWRQERWRLFEDNSYHLRTSNAVVWCLAEISVFEWNIGINISKSCSRMEGESRAVLPDGWIGEIPESPTVFIEVVLGDIWTVRNTKGPGNWTFRCRFGGKSRADKYDSKKNRFHCRAFVNFRRTGELMKLTSHCWQHTHPLSDLFLRTWLRPSREVVEKVRTLTRDGGSAPEIRRDIAVPIRAKMFYELRRPVLRERRANACNELREFSLPLLDRWLITHHYEQGDDGENRELVGGTYISRRFASSAIAKDVVQMDDIVGTNLNNLALLNIVFQDENEKLQVLAFAVLRDRDMRSFVMVLEDIKSLVGHPRVFLVDRYRPQIEAVEMVFPEAQIVFCAVHLRRNIVRVFREDSNQALDVFHKFVTGKVDLDEYKEALWSLMTGRNGQQRHQRAIQLFIDDAKYYAPEAMVRMRGLVCTNLVECFHSVLKKRIGSNQHSIGKVVNEISKICDTFVLNSFAEKFDLPASVWTGRTLGTLAARTIKAHYDQAVAIRSALLSNELTPTDEGLIRGECHCICQSDYGLPCVHVLFKRLAEERVPLLDENDVPVIYYRQSNANSRRNDVIRETTTHKRGPGSNWNYAHLMARLEPIAAAASKIPEVREALGEMLTKLETVNLGAHAGPKVSRPANHVGLPGRPRSKQVRHCRFCGQAGHNMRSCQALKAQRAKMQEEIHQEEESVNDPESGQNTGANSEAEGESSNDHLKASHEALRNTYEELMQMYKELEESDEERMRSDDERRGSDGERMRSDEEEQRSDEERMRSDEEEQRSDGDREVHLESARRRGLLCQLNARQRFLYDKYRHIFKHFLFQIAEKKEDGELPVLHGIYLNQLARVEREYWTFADGSPIDLIYEVNYGHRMPENLRPHLNKLVEDVHIGAIADWVMLTDYSDDA